MITTMPLSEAKEANRVYKPYGAAAALMECRDPEVLLDGPVRTGKSLGDLNKLFLCAELCPRMRGAILRKTRKSLTQTTLVTWEEEVVDAGHSCLRGPQREQRSTYRFPNGSEVIVAGLDDPQKVFGGQFDMIVIPEITELDEDDLDKVATRMSNGVMSYQQIIGDCNPDVPMHWLLKRCEKGQMTRFSSHHEDNPRHWDRERGEWTPAGIAYMSRLDNLQGFLKQRLRDGLWVAAEGAVYDCFDTDNDVIAPRDLDADWPRYVGLDFGAVHTAALFYAADPDNDDLYLYREYLEGGRTAAQHAFHLRLHEPERLTVVGGSASEEQWRREFSLAGLPVLEPRITDVALGISRVYGQHKRHAIKVFKTCTGYLGQKADYRYKRDSAVPGEIENKHMYHYLDAERYIVGWLRPERDTWVPGRPGRKGLAKARER